MYFAINPCTKYVVRSLLHSALWHATTVSALDVSKIRLWRYSFACDAVFLWRRRKTTRLQPHTFQRTCFPFIRQILPFMPTGQAPTPPKTRLLHCLEDPVLIEPSEQRLQGISRIQLHMNVRECPAQLLKNNAVHNGESVSKTPAAVSNLGIHKNVKRCTARSMLSSAIM